MNIVIAGAGDVGFHLAELLATENQNIVLIDNDQEVLDYAGSHLDVLTVRGDATSIATLETARVRNADLLLAVTTSEQTNMMAAILSKKMGAGRVIARVDNEEYLNCDGTRDDLLPGHRPAHQPPPAGLAGDRAADQEVLLYR